MPKIELVALIDMDGTIAAFDGAMQRDLARVQSPEEGSSVVGPDDQDDPAWLRARKNLIKSQPGWWRNLPEHSPGMQIAALLENLGFDLVVLTKGPWKATQAWSEKIEWCRAHLPHVPVTITEDKGLVYGKVLVDDWPAYGIRWLQWRPRGLLIVPAQRWNTLDQYPLELHNNIFRYHGDEDRAALTERLLKIKETAR